MMIVHVNEFLLEHENSEQCRLESILPFTKHYYYFRTKQAKETQKRSMKEHQQTLKKNGLFNDVRNTLKGNGLLQLNSNTKNG